MNISKHSIALNLVTLGLLLQIAVAQAQAANQFALVADTVGGGATASGGAYRLVGVAGQVATGTAAGGQYTVSAGLLANPLAPAGTTLYLPLVRR